MSSRKNLNNTPKKVTSISKVKLDVVEGRNTTTNSHQLLIFQNPGISCKYYQYLTSATPEPRGSLP